MSTRLHQPILVPDDVADLPVPTSVAGAMARTR
jgi:hypothetical protein